MEIKIPSMGESITSAVIASWSKHDGDHVKPDDVLCELETDKVTVEIKAENRGVLTVLIPAQATVKIGEVIGFLELDINSSISEESPGSRALTAVENELDSNSLNMLENLSPSVRKLVAEHQLEVHEIKGTGKHGLILKEDVQKYIEEHNSRQSLSDTPNQPDVSPVNSVESIGQASPNDKTKSELNIARNSFESLEPRERVVPMTTMRKTIARHLLAAQQNSAILTTFNEVDMSRVIELKKKHGEEFLKKHNVKLGFMGFFCMATLEALKAYPAVNAEIRGDDIIYKNYYNIGIAVGGPKGLVVPVLKNAHTMNIAEIEFIISDLAAKVSTSTISVSDLLGGTFSITNGGIYGSMMSTPIINPPQSGILGMHNIVKRAVVVDDIIVIRPMMYLALSYDHRIVDGKEAVQFLVRIKDVIENPERLILSM